MILIRQCVICISRNNGQISYSNPIVCQLVTVIFGIHSNYGVRANLCRSHSAVVTGAKVDISDGQISESCSLNHVPIHIFYNDGHLIFITISNLGIGDLNISSLRNNDKVSHNRSCNCNLRVHFCGNISNLGIGTVTCDRIGQCGHNYSSIFRYTNSEIADLIGIFLIQHIILICRCRHINVVEGRNCENIVSIIVIPIQLCLINIGINHHDAGIYRGIVIGIGNNANDQIRSDFCITLVIMECQSRFTGHLLNN